MTEVKERIENIGKKNLNDRNETRKTEVNFEIGSKVFCLNEKRRKDEPLFSGQFFIIDKKKNPNVLLVDKGNQKQWIHLKQLKLFCEEDQNVVSNDKKITEKEEDQ